MSISPCTDSNHKRWFSGWWKVYPSPSPLCYHVLQHKGILSPKINVLDLAQKSLRINNKQAFRTLIPNKPQSVTERRREGDGGWKKEGCRAEDERRKSSCVHADAAVDWCQLKAGRKDGGNQCGWISPWWGGGGVRALWTSCQRPVVRWNISLAYTHPDSYWHFVTALLISLSDVATSTGHPQAAGGRWRSTPTRDQETAEGSERPNGKSGVVLWASLGSRFNQLDWTLAGQKQW